jgi:phage gp45-like
MGDTGIPLVVATDDRRFRPTGLEGGQWALYDKDGIRILRGPSGEIVITAKAGQKVFLSDGTGGTDPLVPHSAYAIHTHPTGTGPSGPPDNAATAKTATVEAQ